MKVLLSTIILILLLECSLRLLGGLPRGIFLRMMPSDEYLYPPNKDISRIWATIPYSIKSNNLGFRGNFDIEVEKSPGIFRIASVGDSITDGFFVDNEDTHPHHLHLYLNRSKNVEVINAAKGGGSIHKQYDIYRKYVEKLRPDLVVLTFVTNDINELKKRSQQELLEFQIQTDTNNFVNWLISYTALGETALDLFLRLQSEQYSSANVNLIGDPSRYEIENNDDYENNGKLLHELSIKWNNMVLQSPYTQDTKRDIENYLFVLDHFRAYLKKNNTRLVFAYYPSYSQIYYEGVTMEIRDILQKHAKTENIPFIDLTPIFKAHAYGKPLHLAPIDFHPNPDGNKLIAHTIGKFLLDNNLIP